MLRDVGGGIARDNLVKTELVIFLRPTIVDASNAANVSGSVSDYYVGMDELGPASSVEYR